MITVDVALNGRLIQRLEVANTSPDLPEDSRYDYRFGAPDPAGGVAWGPWFLLAGHRRSEGVWWLVLRVLERRLRGAADEDPSDYREPSRLPWTSVTREADGALQGQSHSGELGEQQPDQCDRGGEGEPHGPRAAVQQETHVSGGA